MYKIRKSWNEMKELSPTENIESIQAIFEELYTYGLDTFQWSSFSQPLLVKKNYEAYKEKYPHVRTLKLTERLKLKREFSATLPNHFFIEAFGFQFIRQTGQTFEGIAQSILKKVKAMHNCPSHEWVYNQRAEKKRCTHCGFQGDCTLEEALTHYDKGSYTLNEFETLEFDHTNPLCSCGSHKILYLQKSYMPEKMNQCLECNTYIPFDEEDFPCTLEDMIKEDFVFKHDTSMSEKDFKTFLAPWIHDLYEHYTYVEQTTASFVEWMQPILDTTTKIVHLYLNKEGQPNSFRVHSITLYSYEVSGDNVHWQCSFKLEEMDKRIPTSTEVFNRDIKAMTDAMADS